MNDYAIKYSRVSSFKLSRLCVNVFTFLGLACFSLSLFMPVVFTSGEDIYGFWVLITGWIGVIFIQVAWYANPVNFLALLLARENPRIAFLLSLLAFMLALGAFLLYEIPIGINYEKLFIKEFGLGFYLWITAHFLLMCALFFNCLDS